MQWRIFGVLKIYSASLFPEIKYLIFAFIIPWLFYDDISTEIRQIILKIIWKIVHIFITDT